jgi:hypothetical protein
MKYGNTFAQGNFPVIAKANVTAGFKWAPLTAATEYTPTKTAIAQPNVITIQPPLLPLVLFKITLPTTPSPKTMRIAVPVNSPTKGVIFVSCEGLNGHWGIWAMVNGQWSLVIESLGHWVIGHWVNGQLIMVNS